MAAAARAEWPRPQQPRSRQHLLGQPLLAAAPLACHVQRRGLVHEILANGDIPFPKVRVVDDEGLVGDFFIGEALALAKQRRRDLVVLSGTVEPPLCRLVTVADFEREQTERAAEDVVLQQKRMQREFAFDPALKVKGMRFTAMIDEHDLERKVNQVRGFLDKGHRVEVRILQCRCTAEDVLDLGLRICAEIRDIAKPENLVDSVKEFRQAVNAPKSKKRSGKDWTASEQLRLRLWPCTPSQAASFQIPAHILGPRRRKGPAIVGIDDFEPPPDAWKLNRKPGGRIPHLGQMMQDVGDEE